MTVPFPPNKLVPPSTAAAITDSSSPDYAVVFGGYYMGFSLRRMSIPTL